MAEIRTSDIDFLLFLLPSKVLTTPHASFHGFYPHTRLRLERQGTSKLKLFLYPIYSILNFLKFREEIKIPLM